MRIWLKFLYDHVGWDVFCLAADAKTVISPHIRIPHDKTLMDLLKVAGANEEMLASMGQKMSTGRGTIDIDVTETGSELLQIVDART